MKSITTRSSHTNYINDTKSALRAALGPGFQQAAVTEKTLRVITAGHKPFLDN